MNVKKYSLEIKDIKKFIELFGQGSKTFKQRKELFERQQSVVEEEINKLEKILGMLKYKFNKVTIANNKSLRG